MSPKKRFGSLPLFWKIYAFVLGVVLIVVLLTEFLFEPLAEILILGHTDFSTDWYELPAWSVSILITSLGCGYFFSKRLSARIEAVSRGARALSHGNFDVRLPVRPDSRDDLDILAESFNNMAEAVGRQMQNEQRLLADVSHELRSPLARMALAAELLARKKDGADITPDIQRLEKEIGRMDDIVATLLAQARGRCGGGEDGLVDLGGILREVAEDCRFLGRGGRKAIHLDLAEGLFVTGNAAMLQSMVSNVLANAVSYTPPKSCVTVAALCGEGMATITVRDFGPGVPENRLDDIFRPFYRVDDSRARANGGMGLGLALSRETVFRHGGTIRARNALPGLEITITLPLAVIPS